jgi:hypothetical protein
MSATVVTKKSSSANSAVKPQQPVQGYTVARPGGVCSVTGVLIAPGEKFMALLHETPGGFDRADISLAAWPDAPRGHALAFWQSVMPHPEQTKKKPFVDDEVLCTLFERLQDATEELKLHFRFVLGLILIRKRLLVYESGATEAGRDFWVVRFRGRDVTMHLLDPKLTEQQVRDVSTQLAQVMNEEL